jgi:hypothetical protein
MLLVLELGTSAWVYVVCGGNVERMEGLGRRFGRSGKERPAPSCQPATTATPKYYTCQQQWHPENARVFSD